MVPLSYFLIIWVILLGIFGVLTLLTLLQMLRHGLSSATTYVSTLLFLLVTAGVIIGTVLYISGVDWSTSVNLLPTELLPAFGETV